MANSIARIPMISEGGIFLFFFFFRDDGEDLFFCFRAISEIIAHLAPELNGKENWAGNGAKNLWGQFPFTFTSGKSGLSPFGWCVFNITHRGYSSNLKSQFWGCFPVKLKCITIHVSIEVFNFGRGARQPANLMLELKKAKL